MTDTGKKMAVLTITRYPAWAIPAALLSMVIFRLPLALSRKLSFWRLMGSGKNGTFDKNPDWQQWALLGVLDAAGPDAWKQNLSHREILEQTYGAFIARWIGFFCTESHSYLLQPIECHGLWNGRTVFGELPKNSDYEGEIAVMTRATIRLGKLSRFWEHVPAAAAEMAKAEGFKKSYGVGEWPWVKQATFSIWKTKEDMRTFAYKSPVHKEVIRKTHAEKWYSEEMFVRFRVVARF